MSFVMPASRRPSTAPSRVCMPVYEESGFTFPGWFPYNAKETEGKALVVVPGFRAQSRGQRQEHHGSLMYQAGRQSTTREIAQAPRN